MTRRKTFICSLFVLGFSCSVALALSDVASNAKIQINVPATNSRTHLITLDVSMERDIFIALHNSTKNTGMCSPSDLLKNYNAHEIMKISFWGEAYGRRITLHILEDSTGKWMTVGYGHVAIYDDPNGFPKYSYNPADLQRIKQWYDSNIDADNIEDKEKSNHGLESTGAPPAAGTPETHP